MCQVTNEFFADYELSTYITGPAALCEENATYTANVTAPGQGVPGIGPYTYMWRVNDGPVFSFDNPGTLFGNTNQITFYSTSMPVPVFWLYLSVSSADGVVVNDVFEVFNPCPPPVPPELSGVGDIMTDLLGSRLKFTVSPNPADKQLRVRVQDQLSLEIPLHYAVFNALGEAVKIGHQESTGTDRAVLDINTARLPDGLYFIQLSDGAKSASQKFIVQH